VHYVWLTGGIVKRYEGLLISCTEKGSDSGAVYFYSQQQISEGYTFEQQIVTNSGSIV
jgi:hypothetical protein